MRIIQHWKDPQSLYNLYLLERPAFHFPLLKEFTQASPPQDLAALLAEPNDKLSPYSIPTIKEWHEMWKAWDAITLGMIPPSMLHQKPIDLRHKCLFYLGHIPTCVHFLCKTSLDDSCFTYFAFFSSIQFFGYSFITLVEGTSHRARPL